MRKTIKVQRMINSNGRTKMKTDFTLRAPNLPRFTKRRNRRSNVPLDDSAAMVIWIASGFAFLSFTVMLHYHDFWATVFGAIFLLHLIPFLTVYPKNLTAYGKLLMKNLKSKLDLKQTIVSVLVTLVSIIILLRFVMWFQIKAWYIEYTLGISSPFLIIAPPFALFIVVAFIKNRYTKDIANSILFLIVISNILFYLISITKNILHPMSLSFTTLMFGIPFLTCVIPLVFFIFALVVVALDKRKEKYKSIT
ncbi:hypothetical protein BK704_12995 [[Bacillus thuringiensis] serovar konkukian]|uniref:hypothetical protein n=1 Tax=Bacillus cereus group sp. MYBKT111-2 TaxID=3450598 RepID=UPI000B452887|nr:hypothetical protein [Bacillus thuringiensis]MED1304698.1 hypothetical protein [Bacillus pacificus]OUB07919.1 hypothetical protein BK704_12995 [[Bacillus thuringiensis] serovar konkukian]